MEKLILTERQEQVYNVVKEYIKKNKISPTIRELCKIMNVKSTATIQQHLEKLKEKGYITYIYHSGRSISLID